MTQTLESLLDMIDVKQIDDARFTGASSAHSLTRVFGGQVAGQALSAASRTVSPDRVPHSLHSYFLRPGRVESPIDYTVESLRDSRTFSTRRITAQQQSRTIFSMDASFHIAEQGLGHQDENPMAPAPIDIASITETMDDAPGQWPPFYRDWGSLDLRPVPREQMSPDRQADSQVWVKTAGALPHDQVLHSCILACVADLTLLSVALVPHDVAPAHPGYQVASLDHSIWFHRPFRLDDWLLHDQSSPSADGARALTLGRLFDEAGRLVASVAQEGLIRRLR